MFPDYWLSNIPDSVGRLLVRSDVAFFVSFLPGFVLPLIFGLLRIITQIYKSQYRCWRLPEYLLIQLLFCLRPFKIPFETSILAGRNFQKTLKFANKRIANLPSIEQCANYTV